MSESKDTYSSIGRAATVIFVLTIADKILALGKEMVVAHRFGISRELDVFNIAYAFPGTMMLFFSGALISAFVPLYIEWWNRKSPSEANSRALSLWYATTGFFVLLSIACYFLSPFIFRAIGYGFPSREKELGIGMERLLSVLIFLEGTGIVLRGLLHAKKHFISLFAAPMFINIISILLLVTCFDSLGVHALVWGMVAGTLIRTLFMALSLRIDGFHFFRRVPFELPVIGSVTALALPLIGMELIANSNLFLDHVMASQLDAGSVSALRYAFRINDMPIQIVITAVSRAMLPFLSELALANDFDGLRRLFTRSLVFLGFATLPITCIIGLFSEDIVAILLQRGAFDSHATQETARTLAFYSYGLFFYAYTFLNGTFFSALKDTKSLLYIGSISILLNILFNFIFMKIFGVAGIALATTVMLSLVSIIFMVALKSRLRMEGFGVIRSNFARLIAATGCMFLAGYALQTYVDPLSSNRVLYVPMILVIMCLVYLMIIRIFRTQELDACLGMFTSVRSFVLRRATS